MLRAQPRVPNRELIDRAVTVVDGRRLLVTHRRLFQRPDAWACPAKRGTCEPSDRRDRGGAR
jgi:hypothetical protein